MRALLVQGVVWGFLLWLLGYVLGFAAYFLVPQDMIGWVVTPIGLAVTLWVAFRRVKGTTLAHYAAVGAIWTVLAVVLDYCFLVLVLNPDGGYYKPDVILYYVLCFAVPVVVGWWKLRRA